MNIHIPTPLRAYTGGQQTVSVPGATVGEALEALTGAYPELRQHLYTAEGKLRSFVNLYLNDDDIRYLPQKEATLVEESDELTIIPSIAGGSNYPAHTLRAGAIVQAQQTTKGQRPAHISLGRSPRKKTNELTEG